MVSSICMSFISEAMSFETAEALVTELIVEAGRLVPEVLVVPVPLFCNKRSL